MKCKSYKTVTGKSGRIKGIKIKRCSNFGSNSIIKGGLHGRKK